MPGGVWPTILHPFMAGGDSQESNSPVIDPLTGNPLEIPPDVSLARNATIGKALSFLPSALVPPMLPFPPIPLREAAMVSLFAPWMPMDYQRTYGKGGQINRHYENVGNYNFELVAANAGYPLPIGLIGAGAANLLGKGKKSGPFFTNPDNNQEIEAGYRAAGQW